MAIDIIITFLLVFLNGFFVAAEFAIVKVRVSKIELKAKDGNSAAKLSTHIISHLDGYLAATQLGITLASLGLGWIGEPVVSKLIMNLITFAGLDISPETAHNLALPVAFAIITVLHIVFGELAPKSMAIQRAETTTLFIAYPLNFFYWIFRPFIWLLNGFANFILKLLKIQPVHGSEIHSSDELKYLIQQSSESSQGDAADYDIIKNAFDFSELTARQIMIPRNQVVTLDIDEFDDDVLEKLLEEGYSRIPCYEKDIDNIIGIIYVKDILAKIRKKEEIKIKEMIRPVIMIPSARKISSLLKEFQKEHIHLAIIVNEFGGMNGIVTMEDIIEELVGEIQDEYDDEIPFVEKISDKTYKVLATASINDINSFLPHPIEAHKRYDTLAGIIIEKFERIPNHNEKIVIGNYEVMVLKRIRNSVSLVQLKDISEE